MGETLKRYVMPKVPTWVLNSLEPAQVVPVTDLSHLRFSKGSKLFNWRRPTFVLEKNIIQCHVTPGAAYARHYGDLVATAASIAGKRWMSLFWSPRRKKH